MSEQRQRVLEKRIFAKGENKASHVFHRVSDFLADTDEEYLEFFHTMNNNLFLPNSPCLVNAGVEGGSGQLFACFVLPIEDSMESIFDTLKNTAMIHKTGGGTGFNFSKLRAKGSSVGAHGGVASGPISFMKIFDAATNEVKQGGVRRGANMAVLNVDHPDIEEFITCKTTENAINNFNLSVGITDEFMRRFKYYKSYPKEAKLFDKIVEQAWLNGEPGVLFLDRINEEHKCITGIEEEIEATNPCGEQPLLPYESCCLGSINLAAIESYEQLENTIIVAVKMLNRMLDKNNYPLEQNRKISMKNRKIGLGVMGYADWLIKRGLTYGSQDALDTTDIAASLIQTVARRESEKYGNKTVTTIAPTGTLSIIAECSSGIEPLFALEQRIERADSTFVETPSIVEWYIEQHTEEFIKDFPPKENSLFKTANNISVEAHIKTQASWQKYTDNAVSKTINLPNSATKEDVKIAILMAYELGCKGITVYRDGSRSTQVISSAEKKENIILQQGAPLDQIYMKSIQESSLLDRPKVLMGYTSKFQTGCGNLYVTVNKDEEGNVVEIFSNTARGGCPSQSEALTRAVAKALQHGVPKEVMIKQLKGIRCPSCTNRKLEVVSCPDALAKALLGDVPIQKPTIPEETTLTIDTEEFARITLHSLNKKKCPSCGAESDNHGGCFTCPNCGFGKCG